MTVYVQADVTAPLCTYNVFVCNAVSARGGPQVSLDIYIVGRIFLNYSVTFEARSLDLVWIGRALKIEEKVVCACARVGWIFTWVAA